jgi:hypothetical protein
MLYSESYYQDLMKMKKIDEQILTYYMETGQIIIYTVEAQLLVSSVTVLSKLYFFLKSKYDRWGVKDFPRKNCKVEIENTVYFNAHFYLLKKY